MLAALGCDDVTADTAATSETGENLDREELVRVCEDTAECALDMCETERAAALDHDALKPNAADDPDAWDAWWADAQPLIGALYACEEPCMAGFVHADLVADCVSPGPGLDMQLCAVDLGIDISRGTAPWTCDERVQVWLDQR